MQRILMAIALPIIVTACSTMGPVTKTDLQHHHWKLVSIDGVAVNPILNSDLEIGEHFTINGQAGCNRYFGEADLSDEGVLIATQLGTTMMACTEKVQIVETAVIKTLIQGAKVENKRKIMTLTGDEHTLVYELADWM